MTLQPGQILDGKYRIIRELGCGAMGAVYEGLHTQINRKVAIKVLLAGVADNADVVRRFEHEAQAAGRIGSEHIVEVLDLGDDGVGGSYMVMEFLAGSTLGEWIVGRGRLTPAEVLPFIVQLLNGLSMAHAAGIVHRDLKPDNVFLVDGLEGKPRFTKILDFGVSKFSPLGEAEGMSMTRTGTVVGTPYYMAPEQAKGVRNIDGRSDLYSVGVILYEAVTGQVPFMADTFNELIFKIVLEPPAPPEEFVPDLDPQIGHIIGTAMARDRDERYQTASQFRKALTDWLDAHPTANQQQAARSPATLAARPTAPKPGASASLSELKTLAGLSPALGGTVVMGEETKGPDGNAATVVAKLAFGEATLAMTAMTGIDDSDDSDESDDEELTLVRAPAALKRAAAEALSSSLSSSDSPPASSPALSAAVRCDLEDSVWPLSGVPSAGRSTRTLAMAAAVLVIGLGAGLWLRSGALPGDAKGEAAPGQAAALNPSPGNAEDGAPGASTAQATNRVADDAGSPAASSSGSPSAMRADASVTGNASAAAPDEPAGKTARKARASIKAPKKRRAAPKKRRVSRPPAAVEPRPKRRQRRVETTL